MHRIRAGSPVTGRRGAARGRWIPGRDASAVRHPGCAGALRQQPAGAPIVVAGGGIAGLAAATALAERGVPVQLIEPEPQLGGRVRAWPIDVGGHPTTMSRGFHAFFRQYYNLRALLRRADPSLERLAPVADYPLVLAGGHADSFARIPRTPPLNLAAFVATSPSFPLRELSRVDVASALELLDVEFPRTFADYDGESAAAFLDRLRFPDAARHLALEVFARSFFAHPDEFAAGELVAMFHTYFLGSSEGLLFDVPTDDYDSALWAPLGHYLHTIGVQVRTGDALDHIDAGSSGDLRLRLRSGEWLTAPAVVVATDPATTRRLAAEAAADDEDWRRRAGELRTAPPFAVWRLWLDRLVSADRPAFLGTSGFGPLDNVSVLERFERGARRWSENCGGSVVELHAYALPAGAAEASTRAELRAQLDRVYPELSGAATVAEEWLVREDCPLPGLGPWSDRLTVRTPDPRIVLAGDGVRCDLPVALMERAATTGFLAANTLLEQRGLAGHDVWTVPMSSRHRVAPHLRRAMASRATRSVSAPVRSLAR